MKFHRTLVLVLVLALMPVQAGTFEEPEVTDPAGDQAISRGPLAGNAVVPSQAFNDVDIVAAWIQAIENGFTVTVATTEAGTATTQVNVSFAIAAGPNSVPASTANGTTFAANATGANLDAGPEGASVAQNGTETVFTFTHAGVGASPGDLVSGLVVSTFRFHGGVIAASSADDQKASDLAPDTGVGADYEIPLPPVPGATLTVTGGTVDENGVERAFITHLVETNDPSAVVAFTAQVANTGTATDTYTVSVSNADALAGVDITASVTPAEITLDAGSTGTTTVTLTLDATAVGTYAVNLALTSTLGASATATASVGVIAPGGTPNPTPSPTGSPSPSPQPEGEEHDDLIGGPIGDLAHDLGLDGPFGDYAGVVLLALLVLVLLVLLFLLLFLARKNVVVVSLQPRRQRAAPGEHAEFELRLRNRKKRAFQARVHFEGNDPTWKTGILLTQSDGATLDPLTESDQELEFTLNGRKDPGSHYVGSMRVKVPEAAASGARNRVAVVVVPLDDAGEERRKKTRTASAWVVSDPSVATPEPQVEPNVRLADVTHDPVDPEPGEEVTTTAKLENDDLGRTWVLRVVLNVDGQDVQQQVVAVPPRKARAVIFTWTAGSEESHVRVLVFEKTQET